jgi:ABC-2 type transport system ATP-binding protein
MDALLTVTNLHKRFGTQAAVESISLHVAAGDVLGIIGPNGAGKTTTIKMILGLLEPTSGTIELLGGSSNDASVRNQVGYMPESPTFYPYLTGQEVLDLAGALFRLPKDVVAKRSKELLETVGLADAANRQLRGYSKGMLQRICLAQALINKPAVVFLDEPLDGLDPVGRIRMREIIIKLRSEGTAVVLNSHILSDVEQVSTHVLMLDKGTVKAFGKVSEVVPSGKTLEEVFMQTLGLIPEHAEHPKKKSR